jgi:hypothetical protein
MEILAASDQPVFESLMHHIGLPVVGRVEEDPLESRVTTESIAAMATEITEDVNTNTEMRPELFEYKQLAEDYGFVVAVAE